MKIPAVALPQASLEKLDGAAVFRALQDTKTDDRELLKTLLVSHDGGRPRLLDLCGGTGRVARLATGLGWDVVVVDVDGGGLEVARARQRQLQTIEWDLRTPLTDLGIFDAVICAHNAFNEVGLLRPVFITAASALAPAGWFYCEMVTGWPYPREYVVESLMIANDGLGSWTIDTVVVPIKPYVHDLHLLAARYDNTGILLRRIQHVVRRRVFPVEDVLAAASEVGLVPNGCEYGVGRFVFRRIGAQSASATVGREI